MYKIILICFLFVYNVAFIMANNNDSYQYETIEQHRTQQKKIAVEGGEMAYIDIGEGPVILLVHGVPTSSWLYRQIIDNLQKNGYRVIAPDLLGFGNSDKPKGIDIYSMEKQAKRLLKLMDDLGIDSWTHVLHDAGGIWSWELMRLVERDRIENMVILNTIIYKEGFLPPMRFERGKFWGKLYTNSYKSLCRILINATLKNGLCINNLTKQDKKGYWLPLREGGNRALYHFFTSFEEIESMLPVYQKRLQELAIPTMVIWGKLDDILVGEKQAPLLANHLNIAEKDIHLLGGAKHFIQEEKPNEISQFIIDFVKK